MAEPNPIIGTFRELVASQGWENYREHLGQAEARYLELMANGVKEEFDYYKGVIFGLRLAGCYPEKWLKEFTA